jgi:capsular polysaccharide biosynthesis protein
LTLQSTQIPDAILDRTADQQMRSVLEPPRGFAVSAIARNKLIVVLAALACAAAGIAVGENRTPIYTASTTLQVGQVNPNSPGFFGYVQSSSSVATAFSRAISAEPVLATIQHELKLKPSTALSRLSAEPIPQSPVFRVFAEGPTESAAVQLANTASRSVIAYESQSNNSNPESASVLSEYRAASVRLREATEAVAHLAHKHASRHALAQAVAVKSAAAAELRALDVAYTATVTNRAPTHGLISLLAGASNASSDHSSKLKQYAIIGLLAGIVVGALLAMLRERLRERRAWNRLDGNRPQAGR